MTDKLKEQIREELQELSREELAELRAFMEGMKVGSGKKTYQSTPTQDPAAEDPGQKIRFSVRALGPQQRREFIAFIMGMIAAKRIKGGEQ